MIFEFIAVKNHYQKLIEPNNFEMETSGKNTEDYLQTNSRMKIYKRQESMKSIDLEINRILGEEDSQLDSEFEHRIHSIEQTLTQKSNFLLMFQNMLQKQISGEMSSERNQLNDCQISNASGSEFDQFQERQALEVQQIQTERIPLCQRENVLSITGQTPKNCFSSLTHRQLTNIYCQELIQEQKPAIQTQDQHSELKESRQQQNFRKSSYSQDEFSSSHGSKFLSKERRNLLKSLKEAQQQIQSLKETNKLNKLFYLSSIQYLEENLKETFRKTMSKIAQKVHEKYEKKFEALALENKQLHDRVSCLKAEIKPNVENIIAPTFREEQKDRQRKNGIKESKLVPDFSMIQLECEKTLPAWKKIKLNSRVEAHETSQVLRQLDLNIAEKGRAFQTPKCFEDSKDDPNTFRFQKQETQRIEFPSDIISNLIKRSKRLDSLTGFVSTKSELNEEPWQYQGALLDSVPNGQGKLKCQSCMYQGEFKGGTLHGNGKIKISNRGRGKRVEFIGKFLEGKACGTGTLTCFDENESSERIMGLWHDGIMVREISKFKI